MAQAGITKFDAEQLRALVIGLTNCVGRIFAKADPAFRGEVLASIDVMYQELQASGRVPDEALEAIARYRSLLV